MKNLMPTEEYEVFETALRTGPLTPGLRVNTLKIDVSDFLARAPYPLEPVPWCEKGLYLPEEISAGSHPFYHAGLYYLQEASAMLPGKLLGAQPGERVLDLCAAPGGKATQIGAMMANRGILFLNDTNQSRLQVLSGQAERCGIVHTIITHQAPEELARKFPGFFDRVLVDAPCSGEGMFRRDPGAGAYWERQFHPSKMVPVQEDLLHHAAALTAPGGRLVYSTCTFSPEEDEGQIKRFLDRQWDFELVEADADLPVHRGRGEWVGDKRLDAVVRLWPHLQKGEGHFAAVMQKKGNEKKKEAGFFQRTPPSAGDLSIVREFTANFGFDLPTERVHVRENHLYLLPERTPDCQRVKLYRTGLWLGEIKSGRFTPSYALAHAFAKDLANTLELPVEGQEVKRYLKGETLDRNPALPDGWLLVTTGGFPLGWAKKAGGIVKNYYPSHLRLT